MLEIFNFLDKYTGVLQAIGTMLAAITSIFAIVVSIITYESQRRFNVNSVKPILNIVFGDYETHIFIRVHNNGLGPAIIKNLQCENIKNEKANSVIELIPQEIIIKTQMGSKIVNLHSFNDFVESIEGRVIAPDNEITLVSYTPTDALDIQGIRQILKDLVIRVDYADIYDNKQSSCIRDCKWFGRTL
ncbi:hypothetical protein EHE19_014140 [Ruminiclostridium herbifermentans]|uniref:Uncharacterized protein n=1 Tax=Ruminiclostridium herbifermentans TaxID=2488810 RepID=A0A4U7JLA5_9FIRM|nr:hypothetical protein [Ruminiclostridium herbifermentans]QNU66015.1 hypothetical protein EHE19_014140 [Ruminiclostridium herbifermentans]